MRMRQSLAALILGITLFFAAITSAFAVNPDEMLKDPALEARARALSQQLRCMVCQNQSIDDSNAQLAADLRLLVRERLLKGDTDSDVLNYLVSRYGQFVLLKPRLTAETLLLWGAPILLFILAAASLFLFVKRRNALESPKPLSLEEERRLHDLLAEPEVEKVKTKQI